MKSIIRREMISRRNNISDREAMEKSAVIQRRAMGLSHYRDSKTIALYSSIKNEVSTSFIFDAALREGKRVLFPCISGDRLVFLPVKDRDDLAEGPFGIPAPTLGGGEADSIGEAGLILVPGVAYDPKGGRLGYGKGFYDKSLVGLGKRPFIAALAYEFQVLEEVPMHPHDARVDAIVTEERVILCR